MSKKKKGKNIQSRIIIMQSAHRKKGLTYEYREGRTLAHTE